MRTVTYNENEWRLVPVVATPKMIDSTFDDAIETNGLCESHNTRNCRIWSAMLEAAPQPGEGADEGVVNDFWNRIGQSHPTKKLVRDALEWFVSRAPVSPSIQPTYYVKHPDGSYSEGPSSNLVYMTRSELAAIDETIQSFANDTAKPDASRDADAARYRFIRDTPWSDGLCDLITGHRNAKWDEVIDEAMSSWRGEVGR